MRKLLFLNSAQRFSDFALLLLRVFIGLFLIWSVWHNVTDGARMGEFSSFLAKHEFPAPAIVAPIATFLELAIGTGFILGLCAGLFVVAIAMVDRFEGMRGIFPSGCLVVIGLFLATYGAGRFSVDAALGANDLPRSSGGVRFKS
jgi:putative oxidoreductase